MKCARATRGKFPAKGDHSTTLAGGGGTEANRGQRFLLSKVNTASAVSRGASCGMA